MATLTIINTEDVRGILAPAEQLPKEVLEDMIDLAALSTSKAAKKTAARLRARRWTPLSAVPRKR